MGMFVGAEVRDLLRDPCSPNSEPLALCAQADPFLMKEQLVSQFYHMKASSERISTSGWGRLLLTCHCHCLYLSLCLSSNLASVLLLAVATKYHKLRDFKQHTLTIHSAGGQKSYQCQQGCIPSAGSGGNWLPFPASGGHLLSSASGTCLHPQSQQPTFFIAPCFPRHNSAFCSSPAFLFLFVRAPVFHWVHLDNLS